MTIDWNKPVQTRDGRRVTIVTRNGRRPFNVIGYIGDETCINSWTERGEFFVCDGPKPIDLISAPERTVYWAGVYCRDDGRRAWGGIYLYSSLDEARSSAAYDPSGFLKLTFEGNRLLSAEVVEVDQ